MAVVEYAYFDGEVKGNSRVAMAYIEAVRELAVNAEVSELAFSSGEFSAILLTSPIVIFVMVKGSMADAKLQARKILREIGVQREYFDNESCYVVVDYLFVVPQVVIYCGLVEHYCGELPLLFQEFFYYDTANFMR